LQDASDEGLGGLGVGPGAGKRADSVRSRTNADTLLTTVYNGWGRVGRVSD